MSSSPLVSIIVTTRNSADTLEACLQSIQDQTYSQQELIVVDNNSSDATPRIAQKFADQVITAGPERSAQRNRGAQETRGTLLCFIDADMVLDQDVISDAVVQMQNDSEIKAVVLPERTTGQGWWAKCKVLERSYYLGVDWAEAARFFRKSTFNKVGGYDTQNTGTEDYDLPNKVRSKYGHQAIGRISAEILHNEGHIELIEQLQKKFYYGRKFRQYLRQSHNQEIGSQQTSIWSRYSLFFSKPRVILTQPLVWISMMVMKTLELLALTLGYLRG